MFRRLRIRLAAVCALSTGVILIAMAVASLAVSERQLARQGQAAFEGDLNAILFHLGSQRTLDHTWLAQTETSGRMIIDIRDNGRPLLYGGAWDREHRAALASQARETALTDYGFDPDVPPESRIQVRQLQFPFTDAQGQRYYAAAAAVPVQSGWVSLVLLKSQADEQAEILRLRWIFGGLVALACLLLWAFAWLFTGRAVRPIEESRRRQMEFVSAASHELRSPLASIRTSAEAIEGAPPDKRARFLRAIGSECARMSRLVGDMLLLAGADNSTWSVHREETEPETLVLSVVESFEGRMTAAGVSLRVMLPDQPLPRCRWDGARVEQVLTVLLDNALSYTPRGGRVMVSADRCRGGVRFTVADNGPGIPPEDRERIFQRFYRRDESRSRKEHFGLGLSIAWEIVSLHRGRIWVEDAPEGGAAFIFTLPEG